MPSENWNVAPVILIELIWHATIASSVPALIIPTAETVDPEGNATGNVTDLEESPVLKATV